MTAVQLNDVHKAFGRTPVLTGLEMDVPEGSITAILGPSGSGKTTLLRLLSGFERLDRGSVVLGDHIVDDGRHWVRPEHRGVGYVPQDGALFPHLTVHANVGFGLNRRERRTDRVGELLAMVGLDGLGARYPHELSGGQRQRVAVARALAIRPPLVLLDEPFSSLDASLRATVRFDVIRVLRAAGVTTVLVTHDQDEALSVANRVAIIRDGRIAQHGTPEDLYAQPVDAQMAQFLGSANLVEGVIDGRAVRTPLGLLSLSRPSAAATFTSGSVTVLVRPENITIAAGHAAVGLPCTVLLSEYHGHDTVITVATEPSEISASMVIRVRTNGGTPLAPGSDVTLCADGEVVAWDRSAT